MKQNSIENLDKKYLQYMQQRKESYKEALLKKEKNGKKL